ncbi:MAG: maturase [Gammaproteobacteria bacterium]|nr:maturase [Gammaproteobacteria bacterium]
MDLVKKSSVLGFQIHHKKLKTLDPKVNGFKQELKRITRRIRELMKLGGRTHDAISLGLSRKSYWRLSKTLATNAGLSNAHFDQIGFISVRTLWCKIHHPATAR